MSEETNKEVEPCDHEWKNIDDSFDHEFGTEQIFYSRCTKCGEQTHAGHGYNEED